MALTTVAIIGKLRTPGGAALGPGQINLTLSTKGIADSDYSIIGLQSLLVDSNGDVSGNIIPNDAISPADTTYKARFNVQGVRYEENWIVASDELTLDIADITVTG